MPRAPSQANPDEGGDIRQWQRKPRAGRRRPARNGKLTSPVKKRGPPWPPFQFSIVGLAFRTVRPRVHLHGGVLAAHTRPCLVTARGRMAWTVAIAWV